MEVYHCIRSRLTVRDFKPDPVSDTVINKMLSAARWAPSARNRQPWHFIVIQGPDTLRQIGSIASSGSFIGGAPLAVAVVMDHANRPELDAGRSLQQMELAAWSEGIGGCVAGIRGDENSRVKELLGVPEDFELVTVIAFGYPTDAAKASGKRRKPLSEIAHSERFGRAFRVS
jgi:nitroreductase